MTTALLARCFWELQEHGDMHKELLDDIKKALYDEATRRDCPCTKLSCYEMFGHIETCIYYGENERDKNGLGLFVKNDSSDDGKSA